MAQHDMVIDNAPGLAVRTDMNAAIQALATLSLGTVEPTTMYPGQLWLDVSAGGAGQLRWRSTGNSSWTPVSLLPGGNHIGDFYVQQVGAAASSVVRFRDSSGVVRGFVQYTYGSDSIALGTVDGGGATTQYLAVNSTGASLTSGAAAGAVLTTGNVGTVATTSTTAFQVGTTLMVLNPAGASLLINRGASTNAPRIDSTNTLMYTLQSGGNPTPLAGTWASRGTTSATAPTFYLMQRTS